MIVLAGASYGADPASEQIERAQVLRELAETPPPAQAEERAVLPPARLEVEQLKANQEQAVTTDKDLRWRDLLGEQARERNLPEAPPGAAQLRSQQDDRLRDTQELNRKIQQQDLQYRLQRNR